MNNSPTTTAQTDMERLLHVNPNTKLRVLRDDSVLAGVLALSPTRDPFRHNFVPGLPGGMEIDWEHTSQSKSEIYIVFGTKAQRDAYFRDLFDKELAFLIEESITHNEVANNIEAKMSNVVALKFPRLTHRAEHLPSPVFKYIVSFSNSDKVPANPPIYIKKYLDENPKALKN